MKYSKKFLLLVILLLLPDASAWASAKVFHDTNLSDVNEKLFRKLVDVSLKQVTQAICEANNLEKLDSKYQMRAFVKDYDDKEWIIYYALEKHDFQDYRNGAYVLYHSYSEARINKNNIFVSQIDVQRPAYQWASGISAERWGAIVSVASIHSEALRYYSSAQMGVGTAIYELIFQPDILFIVFFPSDPPILHSNDMVVLGDVKAGLYLHRTTLEFIGYPPP